ncbi:MAG: fused MFS/spermidine synthase, partial [Verrucomicrobiaceae bacterium]
MAKANKTHSAPSVNAQPDARSAVAAPPLAQALLALIVFLSGAAIMVIEISAYRLLAPLFGNSAYTWTALIGVVLIAFSAGGYLGGWLSEKRSDFTLLAWLLAGASVLILFVPAMHVLIAPSFERAGLISGPLMVSVLLLLLPGILLGAVSPASLRLYSLLG